MAVKPPAHEPCHVVGTKGHQMSTRGDHVNTEGFHLGFNSPENDFEAAVVATLLHHSHFMVPKQLVRRDALEAERTSALGLNIF